MSGELPFPRKNQRILLFPIKKTVLSARRLIGKHLAENAASCLFVLFFPQENFAGKTGMFLAYTMVFFISSFFGRFPFRRGNRFFY
jgi:hypothetical protein